MPLHTHFPKNQKKMPSSRPAKHFKGTSNNNNNNEGSLRFHDDDHHDDDNNNKPIHNNKSTNNNDLVVDNMNDDDVGHGLEDIDTFLEPTHLVLKHHEAEAKRKSITMAVQTVPHIVSRSIAGWISAIFIVAQLAAIIGFVILPIIIVMAHHDFCFLCGGAEFVLVLSLSVIGIVLLLIGLIYPLRQYIIEKKKQKEVTQEDLIHEQLFNCTHRMMMMDGSSGVGGGGIDRNAHRYSTHQDDGLLSFNDDDEMMDDETTHGPPQQHHPSQHHLLSASSIHAATAMNPLNHHHNNTKNKNGKSSLLALLSPRILSRCCSHYFGASSTRKKCACCTLSVVTLFGFLWLLISILMVLMLLFMVHSTKIQKSGLLYTHQLYGKRAMIVREKNGMVHVVAENMKDLAFAQGVAACQDRLFQMELYKRVCQGTMSEIVGQDALIVDKLSRILGFKKYAQDNLKYLPTSTLEIIESYVNGINAFIASNPRLPPEFRLVGFQPTPWNVMDVLSFEKLIAFQMTYNYIFELARLVILEKGVSLERATELSTPSISNQFTIFTREELNMTLTDEQAQEIETRLFDQSGAFIPHHHSHLHHQQQQPQQEEQYGMKSGMSGDSSSSSSSIHRSGSGGGGGVEGGDSSTDSSSSIPSSSSMKGIGHVLIDIFNKNRYLDMLFPMKKGRSRGSNNWVIHRNLTDSSSGYNVNDPHLDFSAPIIFQQIHLKLVKDVTKIDEKDLRQSSSHQQQESSSSFHHQQQESSSQPSTHDDFELIGASFPGLPSIGIGRNAHLSWSVTLSFTDVQDLYVLTPCPTSNNHSNTHNTPNSTPMMNTNNTPMMNTHNTHNTPNSTPMMSTTHYMIDGECEAYRIREELIHVKGQSEPFVLEVKESRFGPIFNTILMDPQIGNSHLQEDTSLTLHPIALKWTAHLPNDTTLIGLQQMSLAKTMDEFIKATHLLTAFPFCIVFSDREGNIGYSLTGTTPLRQQGHTGMFPMPGHVSTFEYKGYASGSDLIHMVNPKKGYIITANNRITPAGWPYIISNDNEFDYRARRIDQMLKHVLQVEKRKLTQKDMIDIQNDVQSLIFEELKFVLEFIKNEFDDESTSENNKNESTTRKSNANTESTRKSNSNEPTRRKYFNYANELLTQWNGKIERESSHAALWETFLTNLITLPQFEVSEKYWNDFYYLRRAMTLNNDTACIVYRKQTCLEFAKQTFKETVDSLEFYFGHRIPKWKEMHYIDASHQLLGLTPLSCLSDRHLHTNGGTYTVNINNYVYDKVTNTTIPTVNAAVYRQIIGGGEFSSSSSLNSTSSSVIMTSRKTMMDETTRSSTISSSSSSSTFTRQEDLWVLPLGQDGNMFSRNYDNMMNDYIEGKYHPLRTDLNKDVTDVFTIIAIEKEEGVQ